MELIVSSKILSLSAQLLQVNRMIASLKQGNLEIKSMAWVTSSGQVLLLKMERKLTATKWSLQAAREAKVRCRTPWMCHIEVLTSGTPWLWPAEMQPYHKLVNKVISPLSLSIHRWGEYSPGLICLQILREFSIKEFRLPRRGRDKQRSGQKILCIIVCEGVWKSLYN